MAWNDETDHPFAGIAEKLNRADENIVYLNREIVAFFEGSKYPIIPDPDAEGWQEAVDYHRGLIVPVRFSVLCGEIVHHFRSCLDHVAWHFSCSTYRRDHENAIEFPVYREALSKDDLARYNRKIGGITKSGVLDLIHRLQPYQRGNDAMDHPICIVHDMDRFDKHRELAIIGSSVSLMLPAVTEMNDILTAIRYSQGEVLSADDTIVAERTLKSHLKAAPQVAFRHFGNRKTQPVVPALKQLQNAIDKVISLFANEV